MSRTLQIGEIVGDFRIVDPGRIDAQTKNALPYLGAGGFAITYKVERLTEGLADASGRFFSRSRYWALKECFPADYALRQSDGSVVSRPGYEYEFAWALGRFLDEAIVLEIVRHESIVRVEGIFIERGTIYMLMEFISGATLSDSVDRNGKQTSADVLEWLPSLLSALHYIHTPSTSREAQFQSAARRYRESVLPLHSFLSDVRVGEKSGSVILHLDLTPSNIMFNAEDKRPYLIDFGTARQKLANSSDKGAIISKSVVTTDYASFEQYMRTLDELTPQTDLFSLGGCVYFAMTGQAPPFNALARRERDRDPLPRLAAQFGSTAVTRTADAALNLRIDRRPASAEAWRADLAKAGARMRVPWRAVGVASAVAFGVTGVAVFKPWEFASRGDGALTTVQAPATGIEPLVAPPSNPGDGPMQTPPEPAEARRNYTIDDIIPPSAKPPAANPKAGPSTPAANGSKPATQTTPTPQQKTPPKLPDVVVPAPPSPVIDEAKKLLISGRCREAADRVRLIAPTDNTGLAFYILAVEAASLPTRRAYFSDGANCPGGNNDQIARQYLERARAMNPQARETLRRMDQR